MLYNPKWHEGILDWARQQPADGSYDYANCNNCFVGQYLAAKGIDNRADGLKYSDMPHYRDIAEALPWTFGAAVARAEALKC